MMLRSVFRRRMERANLAFLRRRMERANRAGEKTRRSARELVLVLVALLLPLVVVGAPDVFDRKAAIAVVDRAKGDLREGRVVQAIDTLTSLIAVLRTHAPLRVPRVVVVETPTGGLYKFTPAKDGVVVGRTVLLYVEVENARGRAVGDGQHEIALELTGAFRFEGEEIGERALGIHRDAWREVPGVIAIGLDFALSEKAPAGVYSLTLKVKDTVGGTTASADTRFELR
jgi:hypothetical protein